MASTTRRALHFVFKIGNRKETARFYRDVLGMNFLRHEEFEEGCKASCNGPYNGNWSKSMVGYGAEDSHFVLELTYNYEIGTYKLGNDFQGVTLLGKGVLDRAQTHAWPVEKQGDISVLKSPDGHQFHVASGDTEECHVQKVTLSSSNLQRSIDFWEGLCGMKLYSQNQRSAVLGYGQDQTKLEMVDIGCEVDHATAFGRIAFSCPRVELADLEQLMIKHGQQVIKPLVSLDTPGKATVEVVILADPDGHEICFVGDEAFTELSQVDPLANSLLEKALAADKSDDWFSEKGQSKTAA